MSSQSMDPDHQLTSGNALGVKESWKVFKTLGYTDGGGGGGGRGASNLRPTRCMRTIDRMVIQAVGCRS